MIIEKPFLLSAMIAAEKATAGSKDFNVANP
jgi:hypothetical protein